MILSRTSIRTRLLTLAVLSAVLVAILLATTRLADRKVAEAYRSIDAAHQAIQSAREAIDVANGLKDQVNLAKEHALALRVLEKTFLQFRADEFKDNFDRAAAALNEELSSGRLDRIQAEFREYRQAFAERAALQTRHEALNQSMITPLKTSEQRLTAIQADLEARQAQQQMEGATLSGDEMEMLNVVRDCKNAFLKLQNINQSFISTGDQKYVQEYKRVAADEAQASSRSLREFALALKNTNYLESATLTIASLDEFQQHVESSLALTASENKLEQQLDARGEAILKAATAQLADADQQVARQNSHAREVNGQMAEARARAVAAHRNSAIVVSIVTGLGLLLYLGVLIGIIRSIDGSLKNTLAGLNDITRLTTEAATHVNSSSQHLAEGASQQAASIEESSASLEELSSMTKRNADNARQANDLAKQTRQAADKGADDMKSMSAAMEAIKTSSDDVAKIIKTIDEIAFQTNILALNAAVEAARAGSAGMGFAVVADEVRNLAQRSAQAVRETSAKIEGAIGRTTQGVEISHKVGQVLNDIVAKIRQVDELVAEVASASREQTLGISQVNNAVADVDKVTQRNAAAAEESAAAAAELGSQTAAMKKAMQALQQLVGSEVRNPAITHTTGERTEYKTPRQQAPRDRVIQPARELSFQDPDQSPAGRQASRISKPASAAVGKEF